MSQSCRRRLRLLFQEDRSAPTCANDAPHADADAVKAAAGSARSVLEANSTRR